MNTTFEMTHLDLETKVLTTFPLYNTMTNQKLKKIILNMYEFGSKRVLDTIPNVILLDKLPNTEITERLKSLFVTELKNTIASLEANIINAENKLQLVEDIVQNASNFF